MDWEKAEIGITRRAAAAAAPNAYLRIPFILILQALSAGQLPCTIDHAKSGISFRTKCSKARLWPYILGRIERTKRIMATHGNDTA